MRDSIFIAGAAAILLGVGLFTRAQNLQREPPPEPEALVLTKAPQKRAETAHTRVQFATVLRRLENGLMAEGDHIVQVYDYTSTEESRDTVTYTFDAMISNSATMNASVRRITCTVSPTAARIVRDDVVSPVTGRTTVSFTATDVIGSVLMSESGSGGSAVDFARDEFAPILPMSSQFEDLLPEEPAAPGPNASMRDRRRYNDEMLAYRGQIRLMEDDDAPIGDLAARRRTGFAVVRNDDGGPAANPVSTPRSFGLAGVGAPAPMNYDALSKLQALGSEQFYDSVAMAKSALAIQYP